MPGQAATLLTVFTGVCNHPGFGSPHDVVGVTCTGAPTVIVNNIPTMKTFTDLISISCPKCSGSALAMTGMPEVQSEDHFDVRAFDFGSFEYGMITAVSGSPDTIDGAI